MTPAIVAAALVMSALFARPASAQMHHDMPMPAGPGWIWTTAAQAFLSLNLQEREFTDFHQIESQNWFMAAGARRIGRGSLTIGAMFSAEPWTFHQYGSSQVFQTGETYHGAELIDYQHPHDLVMNASARFEWPATSGWRFIVAGGPVDAPALGPEPYMHRSSAEGNPTAPLSHHQLDATHITHGVITAGVGYGAVTIEASAFSGREPDDNRVNVEFGPIDSVSARLSWRGDRWHAQVSGGHLTFPDPTEFTDVDRFTASTGYDGMFKGRPIAFSLMAGLNHEPAFRVTMPAALAEAAWRVAPRDLLYARAELVDKDILTAGGYDPPGFPHVTVTSVIGALTLGYERRLSSSRLGTIGIGADATVYATDPNLDAAYGHPFSAHIFLRYAVAK